MRVLAVSQYYWPEPFNVADMCEGLASRGHEVTVLTGVPNYPEGEVYPGYRPRTAVDEEHGGVSIKRVPNRERKTGVLNRFANYYSFSSKGSARARGLPGDFDAVLSFEISPVMSANPAIAYAEEHGVPLLMYVIDIWPECLTSGGIKRGSFLYRHYAGVSRKIYGAADRLAVTSPGFQGYLSDLLGRPVDCTCLPQYAEDFFGEPTAAVEIDHSHFSESSLNLMFAGNVGAAQDVQCLVRAASLLDGDAYAFHVVGSGSELDSCRALALELGVSNVVFHGRHPVEEMPSYYELADAMVATFAPSEMLCYTLPRKIQSYMAAGKPVIGTVGGEAARVLSEASCGLCCAPGDAEGLARLCREFRALSPAERKRMGAGARSYCEANYSRERFLDTLETELLKLKGTRHLVNRC